MEYVINGRKWWTSGALDRACKDHDRMGQRILTTQIVTGRQR